VIDTGATFSADRSYRYRLWRRWQPKLPCLVYVLLNPSTADETRDDPTIRRCIVRAARTGFGSVEILNVFAWPDVSPEVLVSAFDPVGPENDRHILECVASCDTVIVGWGRWAEIILPGRPDHVLGILKAAGKTPLAFKVNGDGSPKHPLYISYSILPVPYGR
jgi:hypothetical protein